MTSSESESARDQDDADGQAETVREWLSGKSLPRNAHLFLGLIAPAAVALVPMWRVRGHTVDDAYISYRYASNLARGLGLVYNEGERIEGYTNFFWTLLLAIGIKLGFAPDVFAKLLGGASALAAMYVVFLLAERIRPLTIVPCIATWLLASSAVFHGYAVFGLETIPFTLLVLTGWLLMDREEERDAKIPWSGLVFAAAGLTRPEAPLYMGIAMLFLEGKRLVALGGRVGGIDLERLRPVLLCACIIVVGALLTAYLALGAPLGAIRTAGLTGLTITMLLSLTLLPRSLFGVRNLLRGGLFVVPVAAHLLWRKSYYGAWLPNTLQAKTGSPAMQFAGGFDYLTKFVQHEGVVLIMLIFALSAGLVWRQRMVLAMVALSVLSSVYVLLVGGDWMPLFRYMAPVQPFLLLLVDLGARVVVEQRRRVINYAMVMLTLVAIGERSRRVSRDRSNVVIKEQLFWDTAAGGVANWFAEQSSARGREQVQGTIAMGDIGQIGYETDFPVLDLLGLVDPVIAKLPGGYTHKVGPEFRNHFFESKARYVILISSDGDCHHPSVTGSRVLYGDRRFRQSYGVSGHVKLEGGYAWCIFEHRDHLGDREELPPVKDPPSSKGQLRPTTPVPTQMP